MNLHEYQAKRLFGEYGVPIPIGGDVATTAEEAQAIAEKIGGTVVVKAQVHIGGRGKAGGVKLAHNAKEAGDHAAAILGMDIKGLTVHKVLVDPGADIQKELYLAMLIDREARKSMIMASSEGGMDIEAVAHDTPEKIVKVHIDPEIGIQMHQGTYVASRMGIPKAQWRDFWKVLSSLYNCFVATDATLTEINPLIIQSDGSFQAIDGKMTVDDNGIKARHAEFEEMRDPGELTDNEKAAAEAGVNYIQLDGNIGCMVNGAGLAMTSMDVIKLFGGEPANFLDIGGGAQAEAVTSALNIILGDSSVKAVMINIFGGITRCDEVANGFVEAMAKIDTDVPFVIRLEGTNAAEGRAILDSVEGLATAVTLQEAAQKAVALAKGEA